MHFDIIFPAKNFAVSIGTGGQASSMTIQSDTTLNPDSDDEI